MTPQQNLAIEALLGGASNDVAAAAAGVSRRTVERWRESAEFQKEFRAHGRTALANATTRLAGALDDVIGVLMTIINDTAVAPGVRVRAGVAVLGIALRAHELIDMEERLAALEKQLGRT